MFIYPLIFSVISIIIYWLGLHLFSSINNEATFLVTQSALYLTLPFYPAGMFRNYRRVFFRINSASMQYAIYIVFMSIIFSLVNLYLFQDQVLESIEDPFIRRAYQLLNYTFIPFAQGGGWIYQSLMVYFLSFLFGGEGSFKDYLAIIGLSYLGFLVAAIISLLMNFLVYDFTLIEDNLLVRYTIGKYGEALTLILMVFFVFYHEKKFSVASSCVVACLPTGIIILLQILL